MTQKTNPWTFDVRVRERNLKAGSLTDKDVEKYLSQLPDSADQVEPFATAQPALEQPVVEQDESDDIADDEEDDDDGDDVGAGGGGDASGSTDGGGAGGMGGGGGGGEGSGL